MGVVAAVLKLTDLAARVEQVEQSAAQRIGELAASCDQALAQVASLREEAGTLGGRADGIEAKLAEVGALLARMSDQIDGLTAAAQDEPGQPGRGLPGPPGAAVVDSRAMTGARTPPSGCGTGSPRCTGRCSATSAPCSPTAGTGTRCAWPTWTPCTRRGACCTSRRATPRWSSPSSTG